MTKTAARRPNILWFCTDQQRWDTIAALGNSEIRTPNIDRLCARGWAFDRAYAQAPVCTPSRASMMTGRYPASHHVMRNGNDSFPETEQLVTGLLADAGYRCGLIGKLHLSRQAKGEKRPDHDGFETFLWNPQPAYRGQGSDYHDWLAERGVDHAVLFSDPTKFCGPGAPEDLNQAAWATDRSLGFIGAGSDDPWFLMVNLFDPHPPFDPPQNVLDRYDPQRLSPPAWAESDVAAQAFMADIPFQSPHLDVFGPTPDRNGAGVPANRPAQVAAKPPESFDARAVKAAYYAMIENLDMRLGEILDHLDRTGQAEDTLVVFGSDHGEMLGDHGLIYKGCRFYDGLVRVPLVFALPGRVRAGVVSQALVELVDIAPTLLDAAGIAVLPAMQGRSLWAKMGGDGDPDRHKDMVISGFNDSQSGFRPEHGVMVFDGRWKSCFYESAGLMEVYDQQSDPHEFHNLVQHGITPGLKADILDRHLRKWLSTSDAGPVRTGTS
ncbi:MAG: sulfatase [Martelella sp.]|uniref:sulfatase family protein n=1 Tax=Martelella sp. TaxID=1969699 RepID=UPI000C4DF689|nr:sulfatase-like hydrolase/transferase [Martelella sp.]MAU22748.1 sulfatase [Martelella sp.]